MPRTKRKNKINSDKVPSTFSMSLEEKLVLIANLVIDRLEDDSDLWIKIDKKRGVKNDSPRQNT
jgi:hypothetical protein